MGRVVLVACRDTILGVCCMLNFKLMMRPSFLLLGYDWQETELGS